MNAQLSATTGVHVRPETQMAGDVLTPEPDRVVATVEIGAAGGARIVVFLADEEQINALANAVSQARASYAGAVARINRAEQTQPELPDLVVF